MADVTASLSERTHTSPAAVVAALRPKQWVKNGFVLAALVFAGELNDRASIARAVLATAVFCALSASCYLINDIVDLPTDRLHPVKRTRPIASGRVPVGLAMGLAAMLAITAMLAGSLLGTAFLLICAGYIALTLAYTLALKRIIVLDIVMVAAGFVLRAAAGASAIRVPMSVWLAVLTFLLAAFIITGKRRADRSLARASSDVISTSPRYDIEMLDRAMVILASCVLAGYAAYTLLAPSVPTSHVMLLTIPFVAFGLFRYTNMVRSRGAGGAPEEAILRDAKLMLGFAGWMITAIACLYL